MAPKVADEGKAMPVTTPSTMMEAAAEKAPTSLPSVVSNSAEATATAGKLPPDTFNY